VFGVDVSVIGQMTDRLSHYDIFTGMPPNRSIIGTFRWPVMMISGEVMVIGRVNLVKICTCTWNVYSWV